jgi:hypothetical protein
MATPVLLSSLVSICSFSQNSLKAFAMASLHLSAAISKGVANL